MEKQIKLLLFLILPLLLISLVISQNETCTNSSCSTNLSNYTLNKTANCSEQLVLLLNSYNDLVDDFKNGTNCGTLRELLIDNNAKLSNNLKTCNANSVTYKYGFYIIFAILIIVAIYWIYTSFKGGSGDKNE
jgi:hypothetical protein